MAVPEWKDEYSVDGGMIDEQHKKLISMIQELHTAMIEGHGDEAVNSIMDQLASYTEYHFSAEEEFMEQMNYPELESHKDQHVYLTGEVFDVFTAIQDGQRDMAEDVFDFLNGWLINHILETDMKIKGYI
jgi:hemerythrin